MTNRNLLIAGVLLYVALITVVVYALIDARSRMAATYGTSQEQQQWEDFRREMDRRHDKHEAFREELARRNGQPIQAAPPKSHSPRPPALELLDHHFAACMAVSVAGVTMLFVISWGFFVGAILRPGRRYEDSELTDEMKPAPK